MGRPWIFLLPMWVISCTETNERPESGVAQVNEIPATDSLEVRCREAGLVNISDRLPDIIIDLKYSTADNFLKQDVYGDFNTAWLQPEAALMLEKAWKTLQARDPELTFVIYDATRPVSIQKRMWEVLDLPPAEKGKYLSNPRNGSIHNYGAAVDISLARKQDGIPLDMGTGFDHFGRASEPQLEQALLQEGILTRQHIENRLLLRDVMQSAGFRQLPTEWWHYNACSREEAKKRYTAIE